MQSVYSATSADRATGHSLGVSYPSAEMHSVYSAASADWANGIEVSELELQVNYRIISY